MIPESNIKHLTSEEQDLVNKYKTPLFIIDIKSVNDKYSFLKRHLWNCEVLYSYKTNPHCFIIKALKDINGKFVVSSLPELLQILDDGINAKDIFYHSVVSTNDELKEIFRLGINNVIINKLSDFLKIKKIIYDQKIELQLGIRLNHCELLNKKGINTKFGLPLNDLKDIYNYVRNSKVISLKSIGFHCGSNIVTPKIYSSLLSKCIGIATKLNINTINLGGGFPSQTTLGETNRSIDEYIKEINGLCKNDFNIIIEPGRFIVEDSCYCLTEVIAVENEIVFCDISTNILPALKKSNYRLFCPKGNQNYRIAGRLCHEADIIIDKVENFCIEEKTIIKILNTGAYTLGMKSIMGYPDINVIRISKKLDDKQ